MKMQYVRYFLALCEERNFTRAAKRCGISQPSLTNAIQRLEEELGGPLFHRDRTNTRLTDLGILVRPELEQINRSAAKLNAKRKHSLLCVRSHINLVQWRRSCVHTMSSLSSQLSLSG